MSVVSQQDVFYRRFSGYQDPRFPEGYWFARGTVTGDATGGVMALDLVFTAAAITSLNSRIYSLEQLSLTQGDNTDRTYELRGLNMTGLPLAFTHNYAIEVRGLPGGGGALDLRELAGLPLFLGSQNEVGTTQSVSLIIDNVNGLTYRAEGEGYWWGPRSVLIDGGPQRPPTGLYRA